MVEYPFRNQKLPYPYSYLQSTGGVATETYITNDPGIAPGSTNFYVLCLTGQELTDLISVISMGSPLCFPDTYQIMTQKYMQMREYPNEIPEDSCMDLCALIIECMNTSPAVQETIANYSNYSTISNTTIINTTIGNEELIDNPAGCDNDIVFGMTTGLTHLLNSIATDALEIITNGASASGRIGDVIEAIPGIGILPFDDIFQFVESFLTDMEQLYNASYTVTLENTIRCDLYCIAQTDCTLSIEEARNYFYGKISGSLDPTNWLSIIQSMNAGSFIGDNVVFVMFYLILDTVQRGGKFIGFDPNNLTPIINAMSNDPDSDWSIICEPCVAWSTVQVPSTSNPWGTVVQIGSGGDTIEYEYIANWWDYGTAWTGNYTGEIGTTGGGTSPLPAAPLGSLLIGDGITWELAGYSKLYTPTDPGGATYLICNDHNGSYFDNTGYLTVRYRID